MRLHFAEVWHGVSNSNGAGARVFDVSVENQLVLNDFDIYAAAGGAMVSEPDSGVQIDAGYATTAPERRYQIQFTAPGTYYVWLRAWAANTNNNSVNVGLDGQPTTTADRGPAHRQRLDARGQHVDRQNVADDRQQFRPERTGAARKLPLE